MAIRLAGLIVKELIQFLRDRVMLILIFWLYTVEVVICAYALSFDIKDISLAIVDLDRSPASRALIDEFLTTEAFVAAGHLNTQSEVEAQLQSGAARVALIVPQGFQRDLMRRSRPEIQILLDGTNSNLAAQTRGYALEITNRFAASLQIGREPVTSGARPRVRMWYNPDQTYTSFMVLSMIALAALMVGVIHPAASIVREKEVGTIEQLRVTPIGLTELFAAKTLPTLMIGLLSIFPSLLIVWWFGVPLRGSLPLFLGLSALFLLSAIAIGVLVAAVCRTLQQALLLSFFGLFPIMFLSGTVVPVDSMPAALQSASAMSPLRHYLDIVLGIFLKGAGMAELWPQAIALLAIGLPLFGVAAVIFRKSWM